MPKDKDTVADDAVATSPNARYVGSGANTTTAVANASYSPPQTKATTTSSSGGSSSNGGSSSGDTVTRASGDTYTGWRVVGNEFAYFDKGTKQYGVALDNPDFVAEINKNKVLAPSAGENNWRVAAGQYLMNRAGSGGSGSGSGSGSQTGSQTGYNGIPDINAQAQVIQYVTTMLNNLMQATGYVYKYTGMVQGIPQFEQVKDADGNLMRTDQWLTNEATRQNYIAQQVAKQRELDIAKQNADTQTAQTRLSRDQTLASLASDPTKMVQGAMLANLYGTRSGSVPAAFGWQAGAPATIGQYDRASTATGTGTGTTGVTAQGLTTTGAGPGGTATATNLSYNVADVANLRDATSVGLSPQVRAALAGGRVSATGNPSGWMGASSNLNLAVPLSGDFGRIGVDQWNRMDAASKAQYVSLAQANQPGLTADLLDAQIKRQSPGSAAGYGGM